jgi:hypothetical protein
VPGFLPEALTESPYPHNLCAKWNRAQHNCTTEMSLMRSRNIPDILTSPVGHWTRTVGALVPLVIGELVKEPEKKWRFIRIATVALAVINEAHYAHRVQQKRRERNEERRACSGTHVCGRLPIRAVQLSRDAGPSTGRKLQRDLISGRPAK